MNIPEILRKMTLKEKISYCTGADMWYTKAMKKYGIPAIKMADGPHGLRSQPKKADMLGINHSLPATCFPTAVTAGATWNEDLYAKEGEAIGREALAAGVSVVLGPGCNIKRGPLGGRNFEYLSEDPFIAGKMAAAFIRGQQSTGAVSCLKHFAVNSQEYKRQNGDSRLDARTLREIYLTAFEIAVREGRPGTVMTSYNKINGIHASDHKVLLTDILRREWGFDGAVITDWGGLNDRIEAFKAGCDLNMPGANRFMHKAAYKAVKDGTLPEAAVDASVERLLRLTEHAVAQSAPDVCMEEHHALALEIARQGAVLLKNEDGILPLSSRDMVLIGHMAEDIRYQGTGSSHINPTRVVQVTDAIQDVPYVDCCDSRGEVTRQELEAAARAARNAKIAVVVAGLPEHYESEAFDRAHMALPQGHEQMICAVAEANPNTVVVLLGGSPVVMPWQNRVKAILYMGLPGQAGGQAIADLLTGKCCPSGKLTETWPLADTDVICRDTFGQKDPEYREGIYVGYRYYDKAQKQVAYPFGYGLSYTSFAYSGLQIADGMASVEVENTGTCTGAEVVQLYIAPPAGGLHRPAQELKGFVKVTLAPGEKERVYFPLTDRSFALWTNRWVMPGGEYQVRIGPSSRDIRCTGAVAVDRAPVEAPQWQQGSWYETMEGKPARQDWLALMGCQVPESALPAKGAYTLDNSCLEMKGSSRFVRFIYNCLVFFVGLSYGKDRQSPAYQMMLTCATDCPLRALVINGKGFVTDGMVNLLLRFANGRKK